MECDNSKSRNLKSQPVCTFWPGVRPGVRFLLRVPISARQPATCEQCVGVLGFALRTVQPFLLEENGFKVQVSVLYGKVYRFEIEAPPRRTGRIE